MLNYDVVIIGGGIIGTSIARELSKFDISIALIEKEAELAFGVSKSNSGIIHPGTQNPPDSLKGKLCVRGNKLIRKLARELGVQFKEVGELIVAFTEKDIDQLKKLKQKAQQLGVPGLKIVNKKWLEKNEPNLNPDIIAALHAPTAGIISPYRMVYDLAENAVENGVEIFLENKVIELKKFISRGIFEVGTDKHRFLSKFVINAAGLYADEIARMAGVNDIKIIPRKGEEYILDMKRADLTNHIIFPLPNEVSKGILVIKTSDGNPMIGPTAKDIDNKEDKSTTNEGLHEVLENVQKLVPKITEKDIIAYFAGIRPASGKDFIIRHENNIRGLINVAGIQSPGLTAAPAVAELVCNIMQRVNINMTRKKNFVKHRPATQHLFEMPFSKTKKLIKKKRAYGDIVCRCEMVSVEEIRQAVRRGARTLDGIKFRTRAQAGRCHGGFCTARIMEIMAEELKVPLTEITKRGFESRIVYEQRTDHEKA